MVIHDERLIDRLLSLCSLLCSFPCVSPSPCSSLPTSTCTLSQRQGKHYLRVRQSRSLALWQNTLLPDDFYYSETTDIIFQEESGDKDIVLSYLCDAELDDETIGKALSSPLSIQEREEPADRRQAYHSYEESLLPTQSFFAHSRTVRPVHELSSLSSCSREKQSRKMENETIRILLERQKSKFSLILEPRLKDTNFKYPGIK